MDSSSTGLSTERAIALLELDGPNEVEQRRTHPLKRFLGRFWGPSAWMLELIAALSLALHNSVDLAVAVALLELNAILGFMQEQRASSAVALLRAQVRLDARVMRDGHWQQLPARELVRGDLVRVRAGDFVPADLRVIDGNLRIDQSALTGESRELELRAGATLYSGSVARSGEASAEVVATGAATYFGRTTHLVDIAQPKLHVEKVVSRIVRWLFVIVGAQVALVAALAFTINAPIAELLPLALVLLMSAVPVALPAMFTVSMALGSLELARQGVLVTRLNASEDVANMDVLCADKTGTLTMNRLSWAGSLPQPGIDPDEVLRLAAWASNEADQDSIDLACLREARERGLFDEQFEQLSFTAFSPQTRRTEATVRAGGRTVRAVKGAVATVVQIAGLDTPAQKALFESAAAAASRGHRVLAVAWAEDGGPLRMAGLALLADAVRQDSAALIAELNKLGVQVRMITGDARPVAQEVARQLGLKEFDAEVLPQDKFGIVKSLQADGHIVGMTGDGVNDAPALRQAEVGVAVSGAVDVAKGAASVVLTRDGLTGIVDMVRIGRSIYRRVLAWIVNKVSRTILKSGFVAVAFVVSGKFVISALGMVLLVFLTDFVKIALATDHAEPSVHPESWKINAWLRTAAVLGVLMLIEALALLAWGWHRYSLSEHDGLRHAFAFATLLYFALFSIVSIRERRGFWASCPSRTMALALAGDFCVGLAIALHGLGDLAPLTVEQITAVIVWSAVCGLGVNDLAKRWLIAREDSMRMGVLS